MSSLTKEELIAELESELRFEEAYADECRAKAKGQENRWSRSAEFASKRTSRCRARIADLKGGAVPATQAQSEGLKAHEVVEQGLVVLTDLQQEMIDITAVRGPFDLEGSTVGERRARRRVANELAAKGLGKVKYPGPRFHLSDAGQKLARPLVFCEKRTALAKQIAAFDDPLRVRCETCGTQPPRLCKSSAQGRNGQR